LLVTLCIAVMSCAHTREAAVKAVEDAKNMRAELDRINAPDDLTLSYRLHMNEAETSLREKKYKKALTEAETARAEAENVVREREAKEKNLRKRLENLWAFIESEPFPRKSVVNACFAAGEELDKNKFGSAEKIISEAERIITYEVTITRRKIIIIQAKPEYFKIRPYIPVYEKIEDGNLAGNELARIIKPTDAKFIKSMWVSPSKRFVRVSFNTREGSVTGWVKGEFVY